MPGSALADRRVSVLRDSAHKAMQEVQVLRRVTTNFAHIVRTAPPAHLTQTLESFRVEAEVLSFRLECIGKCPDCVGVLRCFGFTDEGWVHLIVLVHLTYDHNL
jgi:hypothetical protein